MPLSDKGLGSHLSCYSLPLPGAPASLLMWEEPTMASRTAAFTRELAVIRASFRQLASAFGKIAPLMTVPEVAVSKDGRPRRRPRLSRQQRAALKLQGKYMGTMRALPMAKRVKVKKIRAAKGIRAAIRAAE